MSTPPTPSPESPQAATRAPVALGCGCGGFLLGVAATVTVISIAAASSTAPTSGAPDTGVESAAERRGSADEPFTFEGFTLTVESMEPAPLSDASERLRGGTSLLILRLNVENTSSRPLEVERRWFELVDDPGNRYAYDLGIAGGLSADLNPGTSGVLENTYEVPADAEITGLWVDGEYTEDTPILVSL